MDIKGNIVEEENRKTATLIYCIIVVLIFGIVLVYVYLSIYLSRRTDGQTDRGRITSYAVVKSDKVFKSN